jgi:hypothetical protein
MAITPALLAGIFGRAQSLLGETAQIGGLAVPVTRSTASSQGQSFEEGFSPTARRVRLCYLKTNPDTGAAYPVPMPAMAVAFAGVNYRVETVDDQNPALWEIQCVQRMS